MGKIVTIGGNRVGSGKKMKAELNNYFRSTHNLSQKFTSSMGSGILYPSLVLPAMRGDSFDIDISADCRTIPTKGPLFGSFKMQTDVYQVPVRLYQGILHNNPVNIGLNMSKVFFPTINLYAGTEKAGRSETAKMNPSCLLKYLGMSGIGSAKTATQKQVMRKINAIPALAYYDIFKNYYANKQEENAYVISVAKTPYTVGTIKNKGITIYDEVLTVKSKEIRRNYNDYFRIETPNGLTKTSFELDVYNPLVTIQSMFGGQLRNEPFMAFEYLNTSTQEIIETVISCGTIAAFIGSSSGAASVQVKKEDGTGIKVMKFDYKDGKIIAYFPASAVNGIFKLKFFSFNAEDFEDYKALQLVPFKLENIDDMRYDLLSRNRIGEKFELSQSANYLPYKVLWDSIPNSEDEEEYDLSKDIPFNTYPLNGLVLKTYQNDIFNNWLDAEQIEGENGINELTQVSVTDGKFSMDALSFAQKLYNMLNRIAVAGNTYEDWQDVVYEEAKRRQIETPIFCGGMSQEIMFDEIVQTTPTELNGDSQALGSLGGRGRLVGNKKGGKIHIKCDEACFIIAITSLTPRVKYSQGNEFYLTDLLSMDDFHKPAMDGIGFQDLLGERMAWWDTTINVQPGLQPVISRSKIGKLPAWIEYMTAVDKAYGDFAEENGVGYMSLLRNYEVDEETGGIKDATTYIDPEKFNYAFAYAGIDAQNFWVEVAFDIKARRLMSAKLIPHV